MSKEIDFIDSILEDTVVGSYDTSIYLNSEYYQKLGSELKIVEDKREKMIENQKEVYNNRIREQQYLNMKDGSGLSLASDGVKETIKEFVPDIPEELTNEFVYKKLDKEYKSSKISLTIKYMDNLRAHEIDFETKKKFLTDYKEELVLLPSYDKKTGDYKEIDEENIANNEKELTDKLSEIRERLRAGAFLEESIVKIEHISKKKAVENPTREQIKRFVAKLPANTIKYICAEYKYELDNVITGYAMRIGDPFFRSGGVR